MAVLLYSDPFELPDQKYVQAFQYDITGCDFGFWDFVVLGFCAWLDRHLTDRLTDGTPP